MNKTKYKESFKKWYELIIRSLYFPPIVVLVAILIITIWPWQNARQNLKSNYEQSVNNQIESIEKTLQSKFDTYVRTLQGGIALLQSSPELITKNQWQTYFDSTIGDSTQPDIDGIGFSRVFRPDVDHSSQSFNELLASEVMYLYPNKTDNRNVIGYDMLKNPLRKSAIYRAIDTGKPTLTKNISLLSDQSARLQNKGFILYIPYYTSEVTGATIQERRDKLAGFVYGGLRANRLFDKVIEKPSQKQQFGLKIYDDKISKSNLTYQTKNYNAIKSTNEIIEAKKQFSLYGATWQFEFSFDKSNVVSRSEQNAPTYILVVGVITASLVFLALLSIFKNRARELKAQKEEEVNIAKDELLSLASHQMRTPATGVKQYLGMVLQGFAGDLDSPKKVLLEKAYTSNERQLHVINQILHLAKLESGRIVLAKHDTNIQELIKDVIDEQDDEIQAHKHKLMLKLPKKAYVIFIDSHMIRMAIENLLSNAIKYTPDNGKITIKLSKTKESIIVAVKDTGIGIDPSQFSEIFKQFTRVYDEKAERVSGTGVGLYLADQLIKLHGGTLQVRSEIGEGTEFIICLPITRNKSQ